METRAIHLFWWQTLQAPERMLDDLARHTDINTLILDAAYVAVEDPAAVPVLTRVYGESYLVPSTAPFVGLPVAVAEEADYAAALGFHGPRAQPRLHDLVPRAAAQPERAGDGAHRVHRRDRRARARRGRDRRARSRRRQVRPRLPQPPRGAALRRGAGARRHRRLAGAREARPQPPRVPPLAAHRPRRAVRVLLRFLSRFGAGPGPRFPRP